MITIILNHQPYDGSDVAWNALRLASTLHKNGQKVHIFLMNDAVDLARDQTQKPEQYDHDLVAMLKKCTMRVWHCKYAVRVMHDAASIKMLLILHLKFLLRCKF